MMVIYRMHKLLLNFCRLRKIFENISSEQKINRKISNNKQPIATSEYLFNYLV